MAMVQNSGCIFCDVIARRQPGAVRFEDEEVIVIDNTLNWVPVMLLVMPKVHMTQMELWENGMIAKVGHVVVDVGSRFCPKGYRVLSNFGHDVMQSQEHGHVHVLGGMYLGPYA